MSAPTPAERIPVLYLAPWVDYGGSDKGTIDWFRLIDRSRFAPSLATTQPSANRRLAEIVPYAEEIWPLPDLMACQQIPQLIFDFIHTREMRGAARDELAAGLRPPAGPGHAAGPPAVVQLHVEEPDRSGYVRYVTRATATWSTPSRSPPSTSRDAVECYGLPR